MVREITLHDTISIELISTEHAQPVFELTESNRSYLREWLPWLDSVNKIEDTQAFITSTIEQDLNLNFVIFYKGNACGIAGFYSINPNQKIGSIGYWLSEQYIGKGIMTEVVKHLLELGFIDHNLNKIEIRCAEGNAKSRAIPERLSFINEATLRECEWLYSKYVNHVVYSLLEKIWTAINFD
ncbi:MAG: GNAT family N-acetyltransferase [Alteromonadales bacterium]|nr:GNAT family N-acetyltransferase [Alteromonadales bacterium]